MVPIFITTFVYLMGWGSLRSKDSNAESRRRARAAYLYFDGAYGFFSRLFLAFGISLMATDLGQKMLENPFSRVLVTALIMAAGWQVLITARKVPRLLFTANGYSTRIRYFSSQRIQPNDPPWNKLWLASLLGGWPLWICLWFLLAAISYSLAWLLFWLRGLLI